MKIKSVILPIVFIFNIIVFTYIAYKYENHDAAFKQGCIANDKEPKLCRGLATQYVEKI